MLAPRLRELMSEALAADAKLKAQRVMLDQRFDLFNELTDWVTDTSHGEAAQEIQAILAKYTDKQPVKTG